MNGTEELLRAGMARFTADVTAPPAGLAARAARHRRRRRIATAAATAGTLVTVAAVAAGVAAAGPAPASEDTRTAAYVISRTESALAATSSQDLVEHNEITASGGMWMQVAYGMIAWGNVRGNGGTRLTGWSYRQDARFASYTDDGRLGTISGWGTSGNRITLTTVSYQQKTWWTRTMPVPPPHAVLPDCADPRFAGHGELFGFSGGDVASSLRGALRCGEYALAGTQLVDGIEALELKPVHSNEAYIRVTFWVDPSTYLPVRSVVTFRRGPGAVRIEYQWLKPAKANVAELHVTIPSGFTKVTAP